MNCHKNAGNVGKKATYRQYEVDDFDFLCIQLPKNTIDCCYIIPQGVLIERGLMDNATKADGWVRIYPHRNVAIWKSGQTAGKHWTESYRIDFANDPLAKLARIVQGG